MRTNCDCYRRIDPSGLWNPEELIGAKVRVRSLPVSSFFGRFESDREYTIGEIWFRVSVDGKALTVIILKEVPGIEVTWKDLEIIELTSKEGK